MDQSTSTAVTSSNITSPSTIITSAPSIQKSSVIVDPSSSDENKTATSALLTSYSSTSTSDPQHTPKRVSSSSTLSSPLLSPPIGKILSRNCNGTMVHTSNPSNEAELQLYRVLQRASLLAYYDTLLEMGGDDVQQLCDAGEEEFLEIMALVGMASKPLHVRRLQKALHEWITNPSIFQTSMPPSSDPSIPPPPILFHPEPGSISQQLQQQRSLSAASYPSPGLSGSHASTSHAASSHGYCGLSASTFGTPPTISSSSTTSSSVSTLNPTLTESQISRIVTSAERLARTLPQLEPRTQNIKKRSARELEQVIAMNENDPRRMDEIRKYSAIYGRFDCKRKPEKPLTLHEVCVNEAAAQICKFIPALLTRRDELFPLARQVVRDSGFGHSATIRLMSQSHSSRSDDNEQQAKRSRLASGSGSDASKEILEENREKQPCLFASSIKPFDLSEATKLSLVLSASQQINQQQLKDSFMKNFSRYATSDFEDTDSRYSFSSSSSPVHNGNGNDRDSIDTTSEFFDKTSEDNQNKFDESPLGVQVISSSGGHIIAVANPALVLSPTFSDTLANIKREVLSPDL